MPFNIVNNKSMKKLQKYELCAVFIDRHGEHFECFVPLLGPATLPSYVGSGVKQDVSFDVWVSTRLSQFFNRSYVTVGSGSVAVTPLLGFEFAPFSIVTSQAELDKLAHRVISLIMCQIF